MSGSFFVPHDLEAPVRGAATGPLVGLTAVVKDMYDIAGTRTGGGNPEWLAAQKPATRHAAAVEQILAAGATITGKTICDEFFYSIAGINAHYGTPTNLRASGRIPGGSSSGSAAACAANACDFALGSDTGGSVRIPASFNGRASHLTGYFIPRLSRLTACRSSKVNVSPWDRREAVLDCRPKKFLARAASIPKRLRCCRSPD